MKLINKNLIWILAVISSSVFFMACTSEGNDTGIEYAPNMYNSDAYEAYTQREDMTYNPNGMTMRLPVPGTIARGQMDYAKYEEGYEASASWTTDVLATKQVVDVEGKALYNTFCQHCHGKTGKNDGNVVKLSEYPAPPFATYQTEYIQNLPLGKIFHTITFGKGSMGSHASQLSPEERWKVAHYVKQLAHGDAFKYAVDSSAMVVEQVADTTAQIAAGDHAEEETHDNDHGDDHNNNDAH